MDELTRELMSLEERFWSATDGSPYRDAMAQDGLAVFSFGTMTREQVAEALDVADSPWAEWTFDDLQTRTLAADVALVSYRATARHDGDEQPFQAMLTSVYVMREGRWLLALHQQTPATD